MKQIRVREFSAGRTVGLVVGTTVAAGLVALVTLPVAFPVNSRVLP